MEKSIPTLAVVCALIYSMGADAASLRCGGRVVTIGDTIAQPRQVCGKPESERSYTEHRYERRVHGVVSVPVEITELVYRPSRRGTRTLIFIGGVLRDIKD